MGRVGENGGVTETDCQIWLIAMGEGRGKGG